MNMKRVAIIMRSKNEQPYVRAALENLLSQTYSCYNLYNVDSGSTDGTLEVVKVFSESVKKISSDSYVPGTVLNEMIEQCDEDILDFLNADAIPQNIDQGPRRLQRSIHGACALAAAPPGPAGPRSGQIRPDPVRSAQVWPDLRRAGQPNRRPDSQPAS